MTNARGTAWKKLKDKYDEMGITNRVVSWNSIGATTQAITEKYNELVAQQEEEGEQEQTAKLIEQGHYIDVLNNVLNKPLDQENAHKLIDALTGETKRLITFTDVEGNKKSITMKQENAQQMNEFLTGFTWVGYASDYTESDQWAEILEGAEISGVSVIDLPSTNIMRAGEFFPYLNTSNFDMADYQIYTQQQANEFADKREHCLIHSLSALGVSDEDCQAIKLRYTAGKSEDGENIVSSGIRKKDLEDIAKFLGRKIQLTHYDESNDRNRKHLFNYKSSDPLLKIVLYENHYMPDINYPITPYALKHMDELTGLTDWMTIKRQNSNGTYEHSKKVNGVNIIVFLKMLMRCNYFKRLNMRMFHESATHSDIKKLDYLNALETEQTLSVRDIKSEDVQPHYVWSCDTETFGSGKPLINGDEASGRIMPYLLNAVRVLDNKRIDEKDEANILNVCDFKNEYYMIMKFLDILTDYGKHGALGYFHNLKFDYNVLKPWLNIVKICEKDGQIYNVIVSHKGVVVEFRDSYKLIAEPLAKFGKIFNLSKKFQKAEAIAYEYYTRERNNVIGLVDDYAEFLSEKDKKILYEKIPKGTEFNPTKYYMEYLQLDCLALKYGLIKFNELLASDEISKGRLSIYSKLTVSSLANALMRINGAYDRVYGISGNLRNFVQKAIIGGRVHANTKYVKKVIDELIVSMDGNSLYTSAIKRLCDDGYGGLPTGKANIMNTLDEWKYYYAIMEVEILEVNKTQQMPFIAERVENGIEYSNNVPSGAVNIDSITLHDYIKFHDIKFKVLKGVYWKGRGNKKIGELVENLYATRLKNKESNPPLAQVLKLMLNSIYGKTIMKKSNTKCKIIDVDGDKWLKHVAMNFSTIKEVEHLNEFKRKIKHATCDNSFNLGHVGCAILSMSRRIMNEMMDIANTHNMPIYYTDTDSVHMLLKDVQPLSEKYREEYGRELYGKQLCQFSNDFNFKKSVKPAHAVQSVFLGKKSYVDILEGEDDKGNIIYQEIIKLKGITKSGIDYIINKIKKEFNINHIEAVKKLFEKLMTGETVKIPLNPGNHFMVEYHNGGARKRKLYTRTLHFP